MPLGQVNQGSAFRIRPTTSSKVKRDLLLRARRMERATAKTSANFLKPPSNPTTPFVFQHLQSPAVNVPNVLPEPTPRAGPPTPPSGLSGTPLVPCNFNESTIAIVSTSTIESPKNLEEIKPAGIPSNLQKKDANGIAFEKSLRDYTLEEKRAPSDADMARMARVESANLKPSETLAAANKNKGYEAGEREKWLRSGTRPASAKVYEERRKEFKKKNLLPKLKDQSEKAQWEKQRAQARAELRATPVRDPVFVEKEISPRGSVSTFWVPFSETAAPSEAMVTSPVVPTSSVTAGAVESLPQAGAQANNAVAAENSNPAGDFKMEDFPLHRQSLPASFEAGAGSLWRNNQPVARERVLRSALQKNKMGHIPIYRGGYNSRPPQSVGPASLLDGYGWRSHINQAAALKPVLRSALPPTNIAASSIETGIVGRAAPAPANAPQANAEGQPTNENSPDQQSSSAPPTVEQFVYTKEILEKMQAAAQADRAAQTAQTAQTATPLVQGESVPVARQADMGALAMSQINASLSTSSAMADSVESLPQAKAPQENRGLQPEASLGVRTDGDGDDGRAAEKAEPMLTTVMPVKPAPGLLNNRISTVILPSAKSPTIASITSSQATSTQQIFAKWVMHEGRWARADKLSGPAKQTEEKPANLTSNLRRDSRVADMLARQYAQPSVDGVKPEAAIVKPLSVPITPAGNVPAKSTSRLEDVRPHRVKRMIDFWENQ